MKIIDEYKGNCTVVPFSEVLTGTIFYKGYCFWLKVEDEGFAINLENGISYYFFSDQPVQVFPNAELIIK